MLFLIPFVSAILFRLGGCGRDDRFLPFMEPPTPIAAKVWRWLMGLPIGLLAWRGWWELAIIVGLYFLATSAMQYGENGWLRKLFGRDKAWIIYGFTFGLASVPILKWMAIIQAVVGALAFYGLMIWSNDGYEKDNHEKTYLDHAWVEVAFGFFGTVFYWFA